MSPSQLRLSFPRRRESRRAPKAVSWPCLNPLCPPILGDKKRRRGAAPLCTPSGRVRGICPAHRKHHCRAGREGRNPPPASLCRPRCVACAKQKCSVIPAKAGIQEGTQSCLMALFQPPMSPIHGGRQKNAEGLRPSARPVAENEGYAPIGKAQHCRSTPFAPPILGEKKRNRRGMAPLVGQTFFSTLPSTRSKRSRASSITASLSAMQV